ncbi:MAG TPA: amidohydrolase family protein, partial [Thermoanaerobaculia bacterium]|nr:amidohydrolase family protein [Thermoanaerobaculia bacterium]
RGAARHPVGVVPTALPAHELPLERRGTEGGRRQYVDECCDQILPALAEEGARFVDVFCEKGVFDIAESRRILETGKKLGLLPRLHADELTPIGGARLSADVGALSADHLLFAETDGIEAMAKAGVVATLLPGTSVFLRMNRFAPARDFISCGVAVALGTDCNPGSSYTESLPAVAFFAALGMGMTVEETLTAMTLNAAASVGEAARRGSLEPGKVGDVVLVDGASVEHLVYHYGVNPVTDVIVGGRHVVANGQRR